MNQNEKTVVAFVVLHYLLFCLEHLKRLETVSQKIGRSSAVVANASVMRTGFHQNPLLSSCYAPELQIIHHDDGATDIMTKNTTEKELFKNTNEAKSLRILIEYLTEGDPEDVTR